MSLSKSKTVSFVVLCATLLVLCEVGALLVIKVAEYRAPYLVYRVPQTPEDRYENYRKKRHPLVGWIQHGQPGDIRPRPSVSFPATGRECASVYGDSFAYGLEVDDSQAWPEVLSVLQGCRVANWGVPGYGT